MFSTIFSYCKNYRAPLIGGAPGCVNAAGKLSQKW